MPLFADPLTHQPGCFYVCQHCPDRLQLWQLITENGGHLLQTAEDVLSSQRQQQQRHLVYMIVDPEAMGSEQHSEELAGILLVASSKCLVKAYIYDCAKHSLGFPPGCYSWSKDPSPSGLNGALETMVDFLIANRAVTRPISRPTYAFLSQLGCFVGYSAGFLRSRYLNLIMGSPGGDSSIGKTMETMHGCKDDIGPVKDTQEDSKENAVSKGKRTKEKGNMRRPSIDEYQRQLSAISMRSIIRTVPPITIEALEPEMDLDFVTQQQPSLFPNDADAIDGKAFNDVPRTEMSMESSETDVPKNKSPEVEMAATQVSHVPSSPFIKRPPQLPSAQQLAPCGGSMPRKATASAWKFDPEDRSYEQFSVPCAERERLLECCQRWDVCYEVGLHLLYRASGSIDVVTRALQGDQGATNLMWIPEDDLLIMDQDELNTQDPRFGDLLLRRSPQAIQERAQFLQELCCSQP
jgi:hypothetical protein